MVEFHNKPKDIIDLRSVEEQNDKTVLSPADPHSENNSLTITVHKNI